MTRPSYHLFSRFLRSIAIPLAVSFLCFAGCKNNNPGEWPQALIEEKLKTKYEFVEIGLSPDGPGKYLGSAKSKDGETLKITIVQDPKSKSMKYDFKGDRGWFEDGKYDLD
ncbi:MAG: hypothetical protein ABL921_08490 [Pirellula sp.]